MNLKLVPTLGREERRPSLPLRRAGERREPLTSVSFGAAFLEACRDRTLHPLAAAEIVLEAAVARQELTSLGCAGLWAELVSAAGRPAPNAISAPQRGYFRSLTMRRSSRATVATEEEIGGLVIDVPVRLFPRVVAVAGDALQPGSLDDAIALEIAAIASGRTLVEWVLVQALALSA